MRLAAAPLCLPSGAAAHDQIRRAYSIEKIDTENPAAATTSTRPEQKIWHSQSELLLIPKVAPKAAPHDLMVSERPWENEKIELARKNDLGLRVREPHYYKAYPFAEFE